MKPPTYDQGRKEAPRVTCPTCGGEFYMLHPGPVCLRCQQAATARYLGTKET